MRRKSYSFVIMSCIAAITIAGGISSKFHRQLQPSRRSATVPSDENLEANSPAAAESSRQERYAKVEVMRSSLVNRSKSSG
jgi:hypothetical protein